MKSSVLLVAKEENAIAPIVAEAVMQAGRSLWHAQNARTALSILRGQKGKVQIVLIDLEASNDSVAVAEALSAYQETPPLVVLIDPDDLPVAESPPAECVTAWLRKPFDPAELEALLDDISPLETSGPVSCDLWGHPVGPAQRVPPQLCNF